MKTNPNALDYATRQRLKAINWNDPKNIIDLEAEGVRYFDAEILPTWIPINTMRALHLRGWCAPNAFPVYFPEDQHERTERWLQDNYFRLTRNGIHYIGNETNFQPRENFDKKPLRICFVRLSEYQILEGGFGQYLIANFCEDHDDRIFFDYAFVPPKDDYAKHIEANIPLLTGVISKRPIRDFDLVLMGVTIAEERLHLPQALIRSGVALHRYQRFDRSSPHFHNPVICTGGIGSLFSENILGDHPIHGPAQNGLVDLVNLGEGELLTLKLAQKFIQSLRAGLDKLDIVNALTADQHCGVYNPTRVVFDYHDKVHVTRDFKGNQIGEPVVYPAAGPIRSIDLIDDVDQKRVILAGPGNEAYTELEDMQDRFIANFQRGVNGAEVGARYIRVDQRPSREERREQFKKINGESAAQTNARFSIARARAEAIADGVQDVQAYIAAKQREFEESDKTDLKGMAPREVFQAELEKAPLAKNDSKARITLLDTVNTRKKFRFSIEKQTPEPTADEQSA